MSASIRFAVILVLLLATLIATCVLFINNLPVQSVMLAVLTAGLLLRSGWRRGLAAFKLVLPFLLTLCTVYLFFGIFGVATPEGKPGTVGYWMQFGYLRILLFTNSVLAFQNFFAWMGIDELLKLPLGIGIRKYLILGKTLYRQAVTSYQTLSRLQKLIPTEQCPDLPFRHRFKARLATVLAMLMSVISDARAKGKQIDNRIAACHGLKNKQTGTWYLTLGFLITVTAATIIIPIPVPGGGFFNFGDVIVVFVGLYAGSKVGALAGGIGSAIADLLLFPLFAPITLIVKGCEGLVCGLAQGKRGWPTFVFPLVGVLILVTGYLVGEWMLPQLGRQVAVADLPANLVQATAGFVGGRALYAAAQYLDI